MEQLIVQTIDLLLVPPYLLIAVNLYFYEDKFWAAFYFLISHENELINIRVPKTVLFYVKYIGFIFVSNRFLHRSKRIMLVIKYSKKLQDNSYFNRIWNDSVA